MSPEVQKILTDLPTIRAIARRPGQDNPLLALALAQARALDEIATWAANAERLLQAGSATTPTIAPLRGTTASPDGMGSQPVPVPVPAGDEGTRA